MDIISPDGSVSPLRGRMQHDMVLRGLGRHTQQDYIRHVRRFAAFLRRPPDTASAEDVRRFQLHQHETGLGAPTINNTVSALRFLFTVTLQRRDLSRALVVTRYRRKLPDVLSIEEAARLLEAAPGIKYKAALGVAYGAGLRVPASSRALPPDAPSRPPPVPASAFAACGPCWRWAQRCRSAAAGSTPCRCRRG
jgi:site-specific recombinase XerC